MPLVQMKGLEIRVFLRHKLHKQFFRRPPLSRELQYTAERQFFMNIEGQIHSYSFVFLFPMKSAWHMNERVIVFFSLKMYVF